MKDGSYKVRMQRIEDLFKKITIIRQDNEGENKVEKDADSEFIIQDYVEYTNLKFMIEKEIFDLGLEAPPGNEAKKVNEFIDYWTKKINNI